MNFLLKISSSVLNLQIFSAHDRGGIVRKDGESSVASWTRAVFLTEIVKGYMIGDLKRLLSIKVIPNYDGNCNFPIALYVFSCMDFLGYLIAEKDFDPGGDTINRINAYIENAFTEKDRWELEPHMGELVKRFRHGLGHEFFPRMGGISRTNDKIFTKSSKDDLLVLDADRLAEMFMRSVPNLERLFESEETCLRAFDRYVGMQERNQDFLAGTATETEVLIKPSLSGNATTTVQPLPEEYKGLPISKGNTGFSGPPMPRGTS